MIASAKTRAAAGRTGPRRLLHIARVCLRHGVAQLLTEKLAGRPALLRRLRVEPRPAPERLRLAFEEVGGTFIKFGQMLALQPDVLPLAYCNALYKLLDRVEPFSYREVERIVTEELGAPPEAIFEHFERQPLATASVGQVHVAWVDGEKVAVKVQRPNVDAEFKSDVRMMVLTMRLIEGLRLRGLDWLLQPMREFVEWTEEELDYRNEARYSERLRASARDNPAQYVPRVFQRFTTSRTLVVEFLDGVTLLDFLRAREQGNEVVLKRLAALGFDPRRFAVNIIDNFLGDTFRQGVYHADLHPANLMILEDSVVGYIDFGITGVMSPFSRRHLISMTLALARGDVDQLFAEFMQLSAAGDDAQPKALYQGLCRLGEIWYRDDAGHRRLQVSFTRVMTDMLALSRSTGILPERDIIKYIRSAIAIDGLTSRFEPDFHVGSHLEAVCARQIQWQQVRAAVSHEQVLGRFETGRKLMLDGPARAMSVLDRMSRGELPVRAEVHSPRRDGDEASAALPLGAMVLLLALALAASGSPPAWGFNLFTAEVTLIALALARLLMVLRLPAKRSAR